MCTAITFGTGDHDFGRNLDLEFSYEEAVAIVPRNVYLPFRKTGGMERHHAMIGIAYVQEAYPLFYDAVNEKGLAMAGLNFPGYAIYRETVDEKENIAPFELIPWVLGQCGSVTEARELLERTNLIQEDFSTTLPATPLHWMLADSEGAIVVESLKTGIKIYDNPIGVLTNNPPFPVQKTYLRNFLSLTCEEPVNRFSRNFRLEPYSRGMGALGLPGDGSSQSRFVRAAFIKENAICAEAEEETVSQFFHVLNAVEQVRGSVRLANGHCVMTVYSSCCNLEKGIYYYTTYENRQITAVDLHRTCLDGMHLISYPLLRTEQFRYEN